MARALDPTVTAWSPLAGGLLTGRYGSDRQTHGHAKRLPTSSP
jgi:aryl-alcohol dehydrogenase-like predicted oxidoreductase